MAGYSRTDTTNNIADGNIINASDFDGEFDAIATAFGTSGHTHDGTAENGGAITKIGPSQDLVVSASLVTPKTTNTLESLDTLQKFKQATESLDHVRNESSWKVVLPELAEILDE